MMTAAISSICMIRYGFVVILVVQSYTICGNYRSFEAEKMYRGVTVSRLRKTFGGKSMEFYKIVSKQIVDC